MHSKPHVCVKSYVMSSVKKRHRRELDELEDDDGTSVYA